MSVSFGMDIASNLFGDEMFWRVSLATTANAPRRLHTQTIIFSGDSEWVIIAVDLIERC